MPNEPALHPESRALYGASLRPPLGTVFDAGVATSFSLEFETALAIPVTLALFASESRDELLRSPLALLEGLERHADHLAIFCEAGRIQARPKEESRLCTLLEKIIVEVTAPNGGAFHPKVWVLRYRSVVDGEPHRMRLLVLSRNLTRDQSWDLSLCVDGEITGERFDVNQPLVNFLRTLPALVTRPPDGHVEGLVAGLAGDLGCTKWILPREWNSLSFAANGVGNGNWFPEPCNRLGIVSPFCDGKALVKLAELQRNGRPILVSRPAELAEVQREVLERFEQVRVMDEAAETEDGEDLETEERGRFFGDRTSREGVLAGKGPQDLNHHGFG